MTYTYNIYQLPKINDIMKEKPLIISTKYQPQSLLEYGYNSYMADSRTRYTKLVTSSQYKKRDFYSVINKFNESVKDYENDIQTVSKKYFGQSVTNNFYKIWEILMSFNLVKKSVICANIADDGMSGMALTKFCSMSKIKNKIMQISENEEINLKTIKSYRKKFKEFADLVIGNADIDPFDYNFKEQFLHKTILGEILYALNVQKKNGNLILKISNMFTTMTIKLLSILSSFYEKIYIYKPLISGDLYNERYVIGYNFKFDQNASLQKKIEPLEKMLDAKDYIADIFPNYTLHKDLITIIKYINIILSNNQYVELNKIMIFIKNGNYFGDDYHNYHDNQIAANKYWIEHYLPDKKNFMKQQLKLAKIITTSSDTNKKLINDFYTSLT